MCMYALVYYGIGLLGGPSAHGQVDTYALRAPSGGGVAEGPLGRGAAEATGAGMGPQKERSIYVFINCRQLKSLLAPNPGNPFLAVRNQAWASQIPVRGGPKLCSGGHKMISGGQKYVWWQSMVAFGQEMGDVSVRVALRFWNYNLGSCLMRWGFV